MLYEVRWTVENQKKEMDIDTLDYLAVSLQRIEEDGAIESAEINVGKTLMSYEEAKAYLEENTQ